MNTDAVLPYRTPLAQYERQAEILFESLRTGDVAAAWRFKWGHKRFRDKPVTDVHPDSLTLADAQVVVACEYAFDSWDDLAAFTTIVAPGTPADRFERAVDAVVSGDVATLGALLREHPDLVRARSARRHHATLLHYLGANGVEAGRQRTPPTAVEVAKLLLDAGAEVDALADLYGEKCTTMSMLVSSSPPAEAGLQVPLVETLLDYGAALEGVGTRWRSPLLTALTFGFPALATALARRGALTNNLPIAAGLGRVDDTARLLPHADAETKHIALALAAQLGRVDVVRWLLEAGEDPNRYNPDGYHSHATPLHQAVWNGHLEVVRLLVEAGARLNTKDRIYQATPLGWANYGKQIAIADYLRERGAPEA